MRNISNTPPRSRTPAGANNADDGTTRQPNVIPDPNGSYVPLGAQAPRTDYAARNRLINNQPVSLRANQSSDDEGSVDTPPLIQPFRQHDRARGDSPTLPSSVNRGSASLLARLSPRTITIGGTTSAEQASRNPSDNDLRHLPELSLSREEKYKAKVYYLVQEIAGPKNEYGVLPPKEGGLGVAALNMLRASQQSSINDVEFNLVLPGTQNVLRYFDAAHEITGSRTSGIVRSKMPYSGEPVLIVCDERLKAIESFSERVRKPDGFVFSNVVSEILGPRLNDGDILHLNGWHFYTVASDLKARLKTSPVILNVHIIRDVYVHEKDGLPINPWDEVIDHSDILVPVSRTYARQIVTGENEPLSEELCKKISQKNIFGIGNGFETAEVFANIEQKSQEMAWIHRIDSRQKGLGLLTELAEGMAASGSTWKLNILGNVDSADKEAQEFVGRIKEIQLAHPDIATIDTAYTTKKKDEILRRSKIFLCTSLYEGSPYAVMEAMNYGLISVVTPKAGLRDLITNGANGFVSPNMDLQGFRGALQKAIDACGDNRYPDMVLQAQSSVPTPAAMFESYRQLYNACVEQTCKPTRYSDAVTKLNLTCSP